MILDSTDYQKKLNKLLNDRSVYEVLKQVPTTTYKNRLVKILRAWKKEGAVSDQLYNRIYPTSEEVSKFYELPKIHKKDAPIGPPSDRV